jgi:hypothetical protein
MSHRSSGRVVDGVRHWSRSAAYSRRSARVGDVDSLLLRQRPRADLMRRRPSATPARIRRPDRSGRSCSRATNSLPLRATPSPRVPHCGSSTRLARSWTRNLRFADCGRRLGPFFSLLDDDCNKLHKLSNWLQPPIETVWPRQSALTCRSPHDVTPAARNMHDVGSLWCRPDSQR